MGKAFSVTLRFRGKRLNQKFAAYQSYSFYHKVSCRRSSAGKHHLQQIQTEQSCSVGHFHHFLLAAIYMVELI